MKITTVFSPQPDIYYIYVYKHVLFTLCKWMAAGCWSLGPGSSESSLWRQTWQALGSSGQYFSPLLFWLLQPWTNIQSHLHRQSNNTSHLRWRWGPPPFLKSIFYTEISSSFLFSIKSHTCLIFIYSLWFHRLRAACINSWRWQLLITHCSQLSVSFY